MINVFYEQLKAYVDDSVEIEKLPQELVKLGSKPHVTKPLAISLKPFVAAQ